MAARPHLRPVPDDLSATEDRYYEQFSRALSWVHVSNGAARLQREVEQLIDEARTAGLQATADHLAQSSLALLHARDKIR